MTRTRARAALVSLLVLAAACAAPVGPVVPPPAGDRVVPLWVLDHGWHTAVALRRTDIDPARWPEVDELPPAPLIEVAWGDREFYMARPATAWMAIKAALGTGRSVLHVVAVDAPLAAAFPRSEIVERRVSRAGVDALVRFIADEHERDARGRAVRLEAGLYGLSWFYAARSPYSLGHTCNTWIARALQTAGLPVTPDGVVTAGGVMRQLTTRSP
jgi:uncharacterized protein (TIGR02117 family)